MRKLVNKGMVLLMVFGIIAALTACGSTADNEDSNQTDNMNSSSDSSTDDSVDESQADNMDSDTDNSVDEVKAEYSLKGDSFTTDTVSGDSFSSDEFGDYDLTMVNVWATWCGPCVSELGTLQEVADQAPEGVNVITLCLDGIESLSDAQEIMEAKGLTAPALLPNKVLNTQVLSLVTAVPTTLFYDKDGDIVGDPVIGAGSTSRYLNEIASHLEEAKK